MRINLPLRQTLVLGAALGILLPAIIFAVLETRTKFESEIRLRVLVPMNQYADMLASGAGVAIWNIETQLASELIDTVLRNPDVIKVTIINEKKHVFLERKREAPDADKPLREERDIFYNGAKVGQLTLEFTTSNATRALLSDMLRLAAALLAQVIFSFGAIWLLVDRRLLAPLQFLQDGAKQLALGNLQKSVSLQRNDEIGSFSRDLDAMRIDISELITERDAKNEALNVELAERRRAEEALGELNATLEHRVDERTRELSNALNQLTAMQAELVRTEKMSALGSLVAGVSHELNTPIGNSLTVASTLEANVDTFQAGIAGGLTRTKLDMFMEQTRTGAKILMRSLTHAANLVASFKQVAADQTSEHRRVFTLSECTDELLLVHGPTLRKTSHTVISHVPEGIHMDSFPGPLGQVLTNLINNAIIHAFEGIAAGEIVIEATPEGGGWVTIRVRDNGRGIPAEHVKHVFDPFFTTKLGQGGSGLGLSIVYNIVTSLLGGEIVVTSTPGEGTCFTLRIPCVAPQSDSGSSRRH